MIRCYVPTAPCPGRLFEKRCISTLGARVYIYHQADEDRLCAPGPFFPCIQYKLSDGCPVDVTESLDVKFVQPQRKCQTKPQCYPAVTDYSQNHPSPSPVDVFRFELDPHPAKGAFRDIDHEVFKGDGDSLEEEKFERVVNQLLLDHDVTGKVDESREEEGEIELSAK